VVSTKLLHLSVAALLAAINTEDAITGHIDPITNDNIYIAIPDAFKPVIVTVFRKEGLLDSIRGEIDLPKLFFADFSILEVDEDEWSIEQRKKKNMTMDGFRKIWLPNPKKSDAVAATNKADQNTKTPPPRWKRCARCASVMDDVLTQRHSLSWLAMQQRRCFCGGYWDNLAPGKKTV